MWWDWLTFVFPGLKSVTWVNPQLHRLQHLSFLWTNTYHEHIQGSLFKSMHTHTLTNSVICLVTSDSYESLWGLWIWWRKAWYYSVLSSPVFLYLYLRLLCPLSWLQTARDALSCASGANSFKSPWESCMNTHTRMNKGEFVTLSWKPADMWLHLKLPKISQNVFFIIFRRRWIGESVFFPAKIYRCQVFGDVFQEPGGT